MGKGRLQVRLSCVAWKYLIHALKAGFEGFDPPKGKQYLMRPKRHTFVTARHLSH